MKKMKCIKIKEKKMNKYYFIFEVVVDEEELMFIRLLLKLEEQKMRQM